MIAYKLVSKNWKSFILDNNFISISKPINYNLKYTLNEETKCVENSIGILCFKTIEQATKFYFGMTSDYKFIKGILLEINGKNEKKLTLIAGKLSETGFNQFYNHYKNCILIQTFTCYDRTKKQCV